MFIRKSRYEELMCDLYEIRSDNRELKEEIETLKKENFNLKTMDKIGEDRIKGYVQKCDELNAEIAGLKSNLSIMKDRFNTSEEIRNKLIDQNCRLIGMLEKYLNEEEGK